MKWVCELFKWEVFKHLQNSLILLFVCLKKFLVGQSLRHDRDKWTCRTD
jgi:hypothetical protein